MHACKHLLAHTRGSQRTEEEQGVPAVATSSIYNHVPRLHHRSPVRLCNIAVRVQHLNASAHKWTNTPYCQRVMAHPRQFCPVIVTFFLHISTHRCPAGRRAFSYHGVDDWLSIPLAAPASERHCASARAQTSTHARTHTHTHTHNQSELGAREACYHLALKHTFCTPVVLSSSVARGYARQAPHACRVWVKRERARVYGVCTGEEVTLL